MMIRSPPPSPARGCVGRPQPRSSRASAARAQAWSVFPRRMMPSGLRRLLPFAHAPSRGRARPPSAGPLGFLIARAGRDGQARCSLLFSRCSQPLATLSQSVSVTSIRGGPGPHSRCTVSRPLPPQQERDARERPARPSPASMVKPSRGIGRITAPRPVRPRRDRPATQPASMRSPYPSPRGVVVPHSQSHHRENMRSRAP